MLRSCGEGGWHVGSCHAITTTTTARTAASRSTTALCARMIGKQYRGNAKSKKTVTGIEHRAAPASKFPTTCGLMPQSGVTQVCPSDPERIRRKLPVTMNCSMTRRPFSTGAELVPDHKVNAKMEHSTSVPLAFRVKKIMGHFTNPNKVECPLVLPSCRNQQRPL